MAGGLGSRFNGLKQIEGISEKGETILEFAIFDALSAGFNKIVLIINDLIPESYLDRLRQIALKKDFEMHFVVQNKALFVPIMFDNLVKLRVKPWGTAHAILCAKNYINEPFVVLNADDYYGKKSFLEAYELIDNEEVTSNKMAMIGYQIAATLSKNGSVSRGICELNSENFLLKLTERTQIFQEQNSIFYLENETKHLIDSKTLVSMNFWCFSEAIFNHLQSEFELFLSNNPIKSDEFFIPFVVEKLILNQIIQVKVIQSLEKWYGITYPDDKIDLVSFIQNEKANHLYPKDLWN